MKIFITLFCMLIISGINFGKNSELILPAIFSDNMVLQQKSMAPFWGKAEPNSEITIKGSWGENASTKASDDSSWEVKLKTPKAGGPFTITVQSWK